MANLILLNNFMHDFGAAGWLFGLVLLAVAWRKNLVRNADDAMREMLRTVLSLKRISCVAIFAFGLVRMLAYRQFEWNEAAGDAQVSVLIVKHIVFTIVFVWGLYYYVKTARSLRANTTSILR